MQNLAKYISIVALGGIAAFTNAFAATRDGLPTYLDRSGTTARMPSMPIANISVIDTTDVNVDQPTMPTPKPIPTPTPDPDPKPECPDGGVKNSEYTVNDCMQDVLRCVNGGALAGGINDMFDEDMRNAVVNGMGLCSIHVDKCVETIRKNCKYVYKTPFDVWVDFNSREVQPAYYNFVLQKTGLTPNQAENTCWLLDKNTYGSSFNAVANNGKTTSEYNQFVGAYNSQNGNVLIKTNPQGPKVNNGNPGVDGARGHYARWDAKNAECLIRVAAYNKDTQITNKWLFGAIGDDEMAQVWKAAGDTFTCNKDLFGFSLLNDTKTAAVVGVGGGTLVGAGVGAAIGAGQKGIDCSNTSQREALFKKIKADSTLHYVLYPTYVGAKSISADQCESLVASLETGLRITKATNIKTEFKCPDKQPTAECLKNAGFSVCVDNGKLTDEECSEFLQSQTTINIYLGDSDDKDSVAYLLKTQNKAGKGALIGAASGAGAGGLATAITAFIENNNISCHLGDNLDRVALGKSYSIGTLRDFYVKWNLNLPDTMIPTVLVSDCNAWRTACAKYHDLNQCVAATFNYKPAGAKNVTLVYSPCVASGSVCVANDSSLNSHGVCEE
ncbi:MAG: hypothetical protein KBS86_01880 [Proteobacteria bacterium]|nr:hypothetical protein [Candidatus Enterousia scatequi]